MHALFFSPPEHSGNSMQAYHCFDIKNLSILSVHFVYISEWYIPKILTAIMFLNTIFEIQTRYVFCEVRIERLHIYGYLYVYFNKINQILIQFLFRAYGNSHFHSASNSGCI